MSATIKDYLDRARHLDLDTFVAQYPSPVLIHCARSQSLAPRDEYGSTLRMRIDPDSKEFRIETRPPAPMDQVETLVKSDRNSFASKILVGRTETNDLVVSHMTVSKHHAFFTFDPDNQAASLTDTGSTNGTLVNGQELSARDSRELSDGDQVAFGDIEFVYYSAAGLYELLNSLSALR